MLKILLQEGKKCQSAYRDTTVLGRVRLYREGKNAGKYDDVEGAL